MLDFLSFNTFISIPVLIAFYYFGAMVMPLFLWVFSNWLANKFNFIQNLHKVGKKIIWQQLSAKQKALFIVLFLFLFMFMELIWRIMFEYMIAYMQMRDALLQ